MFTRISTCYSTDIENLRNNPSYQMIDITDNVGLINNERKNIWFRKPNNNTPQQFAEFCVYAQEYVDNDTYYVYRYNSNDDITNEKLFVLINEFLSSPQHLNFNIANMQ